MFWGPHWVLRVHPRKRARMAREERAVLPFGRDLLMARLDWLKSAEQPRSLRPEGNISSPNVPQL